MTFQAALSGLNAATTELDVTGNNIANSSTNGFKRSRAEFADVFAVSTAGAASTAIGAGVRVTAVTPDMSTGNIEFTENGLDLAISGGGFFHLNDNGADVYTRAGQYHVNKAGFIVNSSGHNLMGLDATGLPNQPLQVSTAFSQPQATGTSSAATGVQAQLNLDSRETNLFAVGDPFNPATAADYHSSTSTTVYDSLGNPISLSLYFRKVDPAMLGPAALPAGPYNDSSAGTTTAWQTFVVADGNVAIDNFALEFNNVGALNGVNSSAGPTTPTAMTFNIIPPTSGGIATGAADITSPLDFTGTTQFGSAFSADSLIQDGFTTGQLSGINIDESGAIQGRFSNGQTATMGTIQMAKFANEQGLQPLGNNIWAESVDSGAVLIGSPGSSNLGLVQSGALESSNVDVTKELVSMIIAQRNFQANAQVISTTDQITQTIINIR